MQQPWLVTSETPGGCFEPLPMAPLNHFCCSQKMSEHFLHVGKEEGIGQRQSKFEVDQRLQHRALVTSVFVLPFVVSLNSIVNLLLRWSFHWVFPAR